MLGKPKKSSLSLSPIATSNLENFPHPDFANSSFEQGSRFFESDNKKKSPTLSSQEECSPMNKSRTIYVDDIPVIEGVKYPPVFNAESYSLSSGHRFLSSTDHSDESSVCTNYSSGSTCSSSFSYYSSPSSPVQNQRSVQTQTPQIRYPSLPVGCMRFLYY